MCELSCEEKRTRRVDLLIARSCQISERDPVDPISFSRTISGTVSTPGGEIEATLGIVDGEAIFEGDIVVSHAARTDSGSDLATVRSTARTAEATRWPNSIVLYAISPDLPDPSRVTAAIRHYQASTNLRFVSSSPSSGDVVVFRPGNKCSSPVGRIGGEQYVTLGDGCSTGNAIHEIGHALGLWHEQSRTDRDQTISIEWQNIQDGMDYNFQTYRDRNYDGRNLGAFDLGSIMMYGPYSFFANGLPTITLANGELFTEQRSALSKGDRRGLRAIYPSVPLDVLVQIEGVGDRLYGGGELAGDPDQGRRLEGFEIDADPPIPGVSVKYMVRSGNRITPWLSEATFIDFRGVNRLEGFAVRLTGPRATKYRVSYQVHAEGIGSSPVTFDGELSSVRAEEPVRIDAIAVTISRKA